MTTSAKVRFHLIQRRPIQPRRPIPDHAVHAEETLDQAPSKWYLTGFLVPYGVPVEQRTDNSGDEEMDEVGRVGSGEDEKIPEKAFARKAYFPSSMGLSVLLPKPLINFMLLSGGAITNH
ncbi:MAG: hypothetical protein ACYTXI_33460 [Nostoc sp.]